MRTHWKRGLPALLLAFSLLFSACSTPDEPPLLPAGRAVKIITATDLHYIAPELVNGSSLFARILNSSDGKQMDYIGEVVDAFLSEVDAEQPDALILSGDITYNGEKLSHQRLAEKLTAVRAAGISVFVVPGNHDISNPNAYLFDGEEQLRTDSVNAKEFAQIYADCGYQALSRDRESLSYSVPLSPELRLILLDTASYKENDKRDRPDNAGIVRDSTLRWLERQLKQAQKDDAEPVIISHHNLLAHNPLFVDGYVIDNAEQVVALYRKYGVHMNLSGHIHVQNMAEDNGLWDIATASLAVHPTQYGVVEFTPGQKLRYHTQRVDVAGWAAREAKTDANLLDFAEYSRDFFWKSSYRREYWTILGLDLTVEEKKAVSALFSDANVAYFAGRVAEVQKELWNSDGWRVWKAESLGGERDYLESVIGDSGEHNEVEIALTV